MSFRFLLYAAPEGLPPMMEWTGNHARGIGPCGKVRAQLSELFPELVWSERAGHWSGTDRDAVHDAPFRLSFMEFDAGTVAVICADNRASPATLCRIMDRFGLNYCCTEFGDFRHPHLCDPDWRPLPSGG